MVPFAIPTQPPTIAADSGPRSPSARETSADERRLVSIWDSRAQNAPVVGDAEDPTLHGATASVSESLISGAGEARSQVSGA
jgi:hypothetical protein